MTSILVKAGAPGKGKAALKAANDASEGCTSLPTGLTADLAGASAVTVQVRNDRTCFAATLPRVRKNDGTQFSATTP